MWRQWVREGRVERTMAFPFSDARSRREGGRIVPSQPVLDALAAIQAGRRADELDHWRAKRLGLVNRAGALTPEGRVLLWHMNNRMGA